MGKIGQLLYKLHRGRFYIRRKYNSFIFSLAICKCGIGTDIMPEFWIEGGKYIFVGQYFMARSGLRLEAWDRYEDFRYSPIIHIGDNVRVGEHCHIGSINEITIGNNVLMGSKVYITDHHHGNTDIGDLKQRPVDRELYSKGKVIIEDNVFIGDNAVIMPGVRVGHNSIIAANAVITKSVPPYSVVCGVPGKIV